MAFWNSAQRRGATLAVTEMQPTPPIALKPRAMSSLPESWTKSCAAGGALGGDAGEVAGRVLDADHVGDLRQPPHRLDRDVGHGARRARCRGRSAGPPPRRSRRYGRRCPPGSGGCNKAGRGAPRPRPLPSRRGSARSHGRCCSSRSRRAPSPGPPPPRPPARCSGDARAAVSVADSPVVPQGTSPALPSLTCQAQKSR